jgi:hypothetical protein
MPRLIEVQNVQTYSALEAVNIGDMLLLHVSGARVRDGVEIVELLGPFVTAVVDADGHIFTPAGPPSTVLLRAMRPGTAEIDVMTGDPFFKPKTTVLRVSVGT